MCEHDRLRNLAVLLGSHADQLASFLVLVHLIGRSLPVQNLHANIMLDVRERAYQSPTPIQAQGIPIGLSGRDILGCAGAEPRQQCVCMRTAAHRCALVHARETLRFAQRNGADERCVNHVAGLLPPCPASPRRRH